MIERKIRYAWLQGKEYPNELDVGSFDFTTNTTSLREGYNCTDVKWWVFAYPELMDGRMTYPSREEYTELNDIVKREVFGT